MSAYWCMPYHVFSGADDNEPFKAWLRAHREGGFYLNVDSGVIHAAPCTHVWSVNFDNRVHTNTKKVASLCIDTLRAYAVKHGIHMEPCDQPICP